MRNLRLSSERDQKILSGPNILYQYFFYLFVGAGGCNCGESWSPRPLSGRFICEALERRLWPVYGARLG
jgi:hypothetical protein